MTTEYDPTGAGIPAIRDTNSFTGTRYPIFGDVIDRGGQDGTIQSNDLCNSVVSERVLRDEAVSSQKIAASIESDNFSTGVSGWKIERDTGNAEFQNVTVRGSLNADDITSGTLSVDRISAKSLTGAKLADGTVDTLQIAAAAITNAEINDLSADKITAGTLDADRINAGTITYGKLVAASADNLLSNPIFEASGTMDADSSAFKPDPNYYDSGTGGTWSYVTFTRSGTRVPRFDVDSQASTAYIQFDGRFSERDSHTLCAEGDQFYFEAYARRPSSAPTVQPQVAIQFRDSSGTLVGSTATTTWATLTTNWQKASVTHTAPADSYYVVFYIRIPTGNASTADMAFDSAYARRMVNDTIINDVSASTVNAGTLNNTYLPSTISGQTFRATAGSESTPGIAFSSATGYGWHYTSSTLRASIAGSFRMQLTSTTMFSYGDLVPATDNAYSCGRDSATDGANQRWTHVSAVDGTINTSDETQKHWEGTTLGLQFIERLNPIRWKWQDTVDTAEKQRIHDQIAVLEASRDDADDPKAIDRQIKELALQIPKARRAGKRWHHGLGARQVETALTELGLDSDDFAGFVVAADGTYSLRYNEFIGPLVNAVQELSARVKQLEGAV